MSVAAPVQRALLPDIQIAGRQHQREQHHLQVAGPAERTERERPAPLTAPALPLVAGAPRPAPRRSLAGPLRPAPRACRAQVQLRRARVGRNFSCAEQLVKLFASPASCYRIPAAVTI